MVKEATEKGEFARFLDLNRLALILLIQKVNDFNQH